MLEAVISLFTENIQGVGAMSSTKEIREFLAVGSHSYNCEKCGPIAKHLQPRGKREKEKEEAAVPDGMERSFSMNPPAPPKVEEKEQEKEEEVPKFVPRNQS